MPPGEAATFNSLPRTESYPANPGLENITEDHVLVNSVLSNPSAQIADWKITTQAGSVTIDTAQTGVTAINGSTDITLYFAKKL